MNWFYTYLVKKYFSLFLIAAISIIILCFWLHRMSKTDASAIHATKITISKLGTSIEKFKLATGGYPAVDGWYMALEGALVLDPFVEKIALGDKGLIDPWGNEYHYQKFSVHGVDSFTLWSYGADGRKGGENENADIFLAE